MSHTCILQAAPEGVIVSSTKNKKSAINDNHLYTEQWRESHVMLQWFINRNVSFSDKWHASTSQCSQTNTNAVQSNVKCKPLACDGQTFLCRNIFADKRNKNTLITSLDPVSVAALLDGAAHDRTCSSSFRDSEEETTPLNNCAKWNVLLPKYDQLLVWWSASCHVHLRQRWCLNVFNLGVEWKTETNSAA